MRIRLDSTKRSEPGRAVPEETSPGLPDPPVEDNNYGIPSYR